MKKNILFCLASLLLVGCANTNNQTNNNQNPSVELKTDEIITSGSYLTTPHNQSITDLSTLFKTQLEDESYIDSVEIVNNIKCMYCINGDASTAMLTLGTRSSSGEFNIQTTHKISKVDVTAVAYHQIFNNGTGISADDNSKLTVGDQEFTLPQATLSSQPTSNFSVNLEEGVTSLSFKSSDETNSRVMIKSIVLTWCAE